MLEKMGWKPGKGLGREERGPCENLKLNFNASRKGMDFYLCMLVLADLLQCFLDKNFYFIELQREWDGKFCSLVDNFFSSIL